VTRRAGCVPRPRRRLPAARQPTAADLWGAARPAVGLLTVAYSGADVSCAELLGGEPPELVLTAMTALATGFLRAIVVSNPDGDAIAADILRTIGLRALEEASR
jgi:hypothetical protein